MDLEFQIIKLNIDDDNNYRKDNDEETDQPRDTNEPTSQELPREYRRVIHHPLDQVIGDPSQGVKTRSSLRNICNNLAFLSHIEPKNINEALKEESCIMAMQEELNQFRRNEVWELVPRPKDTSIIGTKWIFRKKTR